ncbi:acyltransferase family protein [Listeria kieliensis]
MTNHRLQWIDNGRGVAMLLVILGHFLVLGVSRFSFINALLVPIYAFHLPLFFFISGYLRGLSQKRNQALNQVVKKYIKRLVLSYYGFSILAFFWFKYFISHFMSTFSYYQNWDNQFLFSTLLGLRDTPYTAHIGALWFLLSLFFVEVFFEIILRSGMKNHLVYQIIGFGLLVCVFLTVTTRGITLPFSLDTVPTGLFFYFLGYKYRKKEQTIERYESKSTFLFACLFFVIVIYLNYWLSQERIDIFHGDYGDFILFFAGAISGIFAALFLFKKFGNKDCRLLNFVGRHTLFFMATHQTYFILVIQIVLIYLIS